MMAHSGGNRSVVAPVVAVVMAVLLLGAGAASAPPVFTFDYAARPESRWDGALRRATAGRKWDDSWGAIFQAHNESLLSRLSGTDFQRLGAALKYHFPSQARELRGVAAQFGEVFPDQHVSYEYLAAWVYFHELAHSDAVDRQSNQYSSLLIMHRAARNGSRRTRLPRCQHGSVPTRCPQCHPSCPIRRHNSVRKRCLARGCGLVLVYYRYEQNGERTRFPRKPRTTTVLSLETVMSDISVESHRKSLYFDKPWSKRPRPNLKIC